MKTFIWFIACLLLPLSILAQGPIKRTPLTTNEMMNAPTDGWSVIWNSIAGKWSNTLFAASATNAQPPSTVLTNLSLYGVNYAISNIITVNATPNALTNGILLTNAVKEAGTLASATRPILVYLTPGIYRTPTNTLPSVMAAVENVSTYWAPGAEWMNSTLGGDPSYQWDFTAGVRTNVHIFGYGRFWNTNAAGGCILVDTASRVFIQGLSFWSYLDAPITWTSVACDLNFDVMEYLQSDYDTLYGDVSSGQKLRGRIKEMRSVGDLVELSGDATAWGNVDLNIDIGRQMTDPGQTTFLQIAGRSRVHFNQIFVTAKNATIVGTGTTNGLVDGPTVIHLPADGTVSPIGPYSGNNHGIHFRNIMFNCPTNIDAMAITNSAANPTTLENVTFNLGFAATNWVRGVTPSFVKIVGALTLNPFKPIGSQITILGTNYNPAIHNYGVLTNTGAANFAAGFTAYADSEVKGNLNVTTSITAVNVGASGFISSDTYIEALLGYQFPYLPATSLLMLEANKTATNVTSMPDLSLSGTTLSVITNLITARTEDQTPATNDFLLTVDTSAAAFKKVAIGNLPGTGGSGSTNNTVTGQHFTTVSNQTYRAPMVLGDNTNIVLSFRTNQYIASPSNTFTVTFTDVPDSALEVRMELFLINTNASAGYFQTNGLNGGSVILLSSPSTNRYAIHSHTNALWVDSGQILTTGSGDTNVFNINPVIHGPYLKGTVTSDTQIVTNDVYLGGITTNGILYTGVSGQVRTAALSGLTFSGGTLTATGGGPSASNNIPFTTYTADTGSPKTNIIIDASLGTVFRVLLTNNMGLMITNGHDAQDLSIELYQDGTGNRTVTHVPNTSGALTNNWQFGEDITSPITLTTNQFKKDLLKLRYEVTNLATNTSRSNWCVIGMLRKYPN